MVVPAPQTNAPAPQTNTEWTKNLAPGARVFLHQAFRCCPYAGAVSSQIHDYLVLNGFTITTKPDEADVHVVNTCGSDAAQAELTWHALQTVAVRRPDVAVVVTGCLVSIEPKRLEAELAAFQRTTQFDPRHLAGLDGVFVSAEPGGSGTAFEDVKPALHNEYAGSDFAQRWFHVVASTGCLGSCSFCAIRRATGRTKSRSIEAVLADVRRGLAEGLHDILLVSTDLSAWGSDFGHSVVDVVAAVTHEPGDFMLAGESFEPTLFLAHFDALLPHFASGRWAYIGLPIQSGSRRVLESMERTYDPDEVVAAVRRLKAAAPNLVVRTDLLYGFSDETDDEFQASVEVSRAFDLPSFNAYQPRPGTAPLLLGAEVLRARRDLAFTELHSRAQAGLPPVHRWGGYAERPMLDTPREGRAQEPARAPDPWDTDEGRAWRSQTAERFRGVLRRHKALPLARGWALAGAEAGAEAVTLTLRHVDGRTLSVGVRPSEWPGEAMARGPRFAVFVTESLEADAGLDIALKRLVGALGAA